MAEGSPDETPSTCATADAWPGREEHRPDRRTLATIDGHVARLKEILASGGPCGPHRRAAERATRPRHSAGRRFGGRGLDRERPTMMFSPFVALAVAIGLACTGRRSAAIALWALSLGAMLLLFRVHATDALRLDF